MRRHLSSNRCKVKAASTCRRWVICVPCARRAIAPARSSSPTKCRPDLDAAAISLRANVTSVVPDVMTLAKGLSGGIIPVGAFIARPDAWNRAYAKQPLIHTSTFGGSEIACAAALAAMDVLIEDDLVSNARARGEQLLDGCKTIALEYPQVIREVRGLGLLVGVELTNEGYGGWIIPEMLKAGVTAAWTLNQQRVIRLEPPLIVTEGEVDIALSAFSAGVEAAATKLGRL